MRILILHVLITATWTALAKELCIKVNNVAPLSNPSETYKYYSLPFLPPKQEIKSDITFSQSLSGDRLYNSPYISTIGKNTTDLQDDLALSIGSKPFNIDELDLFKDAIENSFYAEFYVEEFVTHDMIGQIIEDSNGKNQYYLKHHIEFNVYLNKDNEVIHSNITNFIDEEYLNLYYTLLEIPQGKKYLEIVFTYNVNYFAAAMSNISSENDDLFEQLEPNEDEAQLQIYWTSIILAFLLVISLLGIVMIVLGRTIKRDFIMSTDIESDHSVEVGWKLIRTEALQPPSQKLILSSLLGNGLQFIFLAICIVLFGTLGLYYNHQKGNVKQSGIFLYSFTGIFNGFYSQKYYKFIGGKHWALNYLTSTSIFPIGFLLVFIIVNSFAWYKGSTSAIPAQSVFLVFLIILVIFIPSTLIGTITSRIKTIQILPSADTSFPRLYKPVPDRKFYQTAIFQFIVGGIIPFISIQLVLKQIFESVWGHSSYHLYGVLSISIILFFLVQACVSICLTYLQLNSLDYNWWWRSFSYGGSTSLFIAIYVVYYYWHLSPMHGTLQVQRKPFKLLNFNYFFAQFLMYYGYMVLACSVSFMMLGSVSFLSSLKFVRYIYDNSKID